MTQWTAAHQDSVFFTISWSLLRFVSIELMPSNRLILCYSLLLLPSIFPSIKVFSNESALRIRWQKYWSFHFSICPSNEYSGLLSFRMDWLDLLAVQGPLKSLLQLHSSKASILLCSAFCIAQLLHPYMTTGKTIALTRWTSVSKVEMVRTKKQTAWNNLCTAGIKIAGRNINNLRYAYDTTLIAESEEELKSLLMKVKEESEKVGLKLNIQKMNIMASGLITSW